MLQGIRTAPAHNVSYVTHESHSASAQNAGTLSSAVTAVKQGNAAVTPTSTSIRPTRPAPGVPLFAQLKLALQQFEAQRAASPKIEHLGPERLMPGVNRPPVIVTIQVKNGTQGNTSSSSTPVLSTFSPATPAAEGVVRREHSSDSTEIANKMKNRRAFVLQP